LARFAAALVDPARAGVGDSLRIGQVEAPANNQEEKRMKKFSIGAAISAAALVLAPVASADGSEALGPPSVPVASGTGIAVGGVGMQNAPGTPKSFTVTVPSGALVKQVLLYWEGHWTDHGPYWGNVPQVDGDDTISVNGNPVTGTRIGGSTAFFVQFAGAVTGTEKFVTYRADITGLGLVGPGATSLTISDMLFRSNHPFGFPFLYGNDGAGVVVVYDAGGSAATIAVRDGLDLAYFGFAAPLDTTVPRTFSFPASTVSRSATLATLVGSAEGVDLPSPRPNQLVVTFAPVGGTTVVNNPWGSNQGGEFDVVTHPLTVPAGASSITVQGLSAGAVGRPASFAWNVAALSVSAPPAAHTLGFWMNWSSCSGGNQAPILDQTIAAAGGSVAIGDLDVATCDVAVRILGKRDVVTGANRASDAAYNLAAQLLAAKLNVVAGAGTCATATSAIASAQSLLAGIDFTGTGAFLPSGGPPPPERTQANNLASTLDDYNNGLVC
jgi:hypothetical protein